MREIITSLFFIITSWLMGQSFAYDPLPIQKWNGNVYETLVSSTTDSQGNIYFLDNTWRLSSDMVVCAVVKVNANGDTLWTRTFNISNTWHEIASTMIVDHQDNIIIGGNVHDQKTALNDGYKSNFIAKYSSSGSLLSVDTFANVKPYNKLVSIAVDNNNNVYASASSETNVYDKDVLIYKLNSSLSRQWSKTYANPYLQNDTPIKIICDDEDNVYSINQSVNSSTVSCVYIMKYNSTGSLLWDKFYNYPNSGSGTVVKNALFADSCLYINGSVSSGVLVAKISKNNSYIKANTIITSSNEIPVLLSKNNSLSMIHRNSNDSCSVILLDTSLNVSYIKKFKGNAPIVGTSGVIQQPEGLTYSYGKNVCASFYFTDTVRVNGTLTTQCYTHIAGIDSTGNVIYSKVANRFFETRYSRLNYYNGVNYLLGSAFGNIYITRYDETSGNSLSNTQYDYPELGGSADITTLQLKLSNGNFVMCNQHRDIAFDRTYNSFDLINPARIVQNRAIDIDSFLVYNNDTVFMLKKDYYDNVYVGVYRTYGTQRYLKLSKYNKNLQQLWTNTTSLGNYTLTTVPCGNVSDSGNVYITSVLPSISGVQLIKYDHNGNYVWNRPVLVSPYSLFRSKGVVLASETSLFVYGITNNSTKAHNISKFDATNGNFILTTDYLSTDSTNYVTHDLQYYNGKLYGTGTYKYTKYQFLISIDTLNLNTVWVRKYNYLNTANYTGGKSLFFYGNNVFVVGYNSDNTGGNINKILISKFDVSGTQLWLKTNTLYGQHYSARFGSGATNGTEVVLACSSGTGGNAGTMNFFVHDFVTGNLINQTTYSYPVSILMPDTRPLNISENNGKFLVSGYAFTGETAFTTYNSTSYYDVFYGLFGNTVTTSIETINNNSDDIVLFPNPGTGNFAILGIPHTQNINVDVYDVSGHHVASYKNVGTSNNFHAEYLSSGLYFVKISSPTINKVIKWVKSN